MSDELPFRIVDAFAEQPFSGNPAGVILGADGLSERQMQTVANEINASETAFVSGANDLHRPPKLRWFTPAVEVGFCGHATLAAAHALAESVRFRADVAEPGAGVQFESAAGRLRLTQETIADRPGAAIWWLDMPAPGLRADNTNPMKTCELLGMTVDDLDSAAPMRRSRDDDLLLFVKSWQRLQSLAPDFHKLGAWCQKHAIRGICVSTRETLTPFVQVASRFFAPAAGIPEDPVTGSVHGPRAGHGRFRGDDRRASRAELRPRQAGRATGAGPGAGRAHGRRAPGAHRRVLPHRRTRRDSTAGALMGRGRVAESTWAGRLLLPRSSETIARLRRRRRAGPRRGVQGLNHDGATAQEAGRNSDRLERAHAGGAGRRDRLRVAAREADR
jgi:PhzF family phenazine biosynthesis protein